MRGRPESQLPARVRKSVKVNLGSPHRTQPVMDKFNFSLARTAPAPRQCMVPLENVWFSGAPWWVGTAVYAAATTGNAAVGIIDNKPLRVALSTIITAVTLVVVYVPFVRVLIAVSTRRAKCIEVLRPRYLVYLLFALQLAQANAYFTVFLSDESAFAGALCGSPPPATCTHENSFLVMLRLVYFSCVTFVSVGYGDITPGSPVATLFVFPQLWAPVFYLGLLFGRVAAEPQ